MRAPADRGREGAPLAPSGDSHRHLRVFAPPPQPPSRRDLATRWLVVGLAVGAVALYAASYFLPWWKFTLYAPQYPSGLRLLVTLGGLQGDVHEIDMLNHYIGMAHLEQAAQLERRLAVYGVAGLAIAVLALALFAGRRRNFALAIPGLVFPVVFLADSFYWLRSFGHHLDPHAPIKLPPFTPHFFGDGKIGQFSTYAIPKPGFWLALAAFGLMAIAMLVRRQVCKDCRHADRCSNVCPRALVGPQRLDGEQGA